MGRRKAPWEKTNLLNAQTFNAWFVRLYNIWLSRYSWDNAPEFFDSRLLELVLFWNGSAISFKDSDIGVLALPVVFGGTRNIFDEPELRTAYAYANSYRQDGLTPKNSVLIFNNYARTPDVSILQLYAEKLTNIDRSIDVNVGAQKTPYIIGCPEEQKLTMLNFMKKVQNNEEVVFGYGGLKENVSVFSITAPYVANDLVSTKRQILSEALTWMGVEANTNEKAERQIVSEIAANMGQTEAERNVGLISRRRAAEKINKMFGTNIEVNFNSNLNLTRIIEDEPVIGQNPSDFDRVEEEEEK